MSRFLMRSAGALSIFPRMRIIMRKLCIIVRSAIYLTVMLLTALWTMSEPAAASAPDRMEIWFDRPAALKGARIWSEPQFHAADRKWLFRGQYRRRDSSRAHYPQREIAVAGRSGSSGRCFVLLGREPAVRGCFPPYTHGIRRG